MILLLFLTLMYKTMGGGSWNGLWSEEGDASYSSAAPTAADTTPSGLDKAAEAAGEHISLAWKSLQQV